MAEPLILTTPEQLSGLISAALKSTLLSLEQTRKSVLTPEDVEAEYPISTKTLERWRMMGNGPSYSYMGKKVVYQRAELERFIAAGRVMTSGKV